MNGLQCFAMIGFSNARQTWWELVTVRSGELVARRSVTANYNLARRWADRLADILGIPADARGGLYCGFVFTPRGVSC